MNACAKTTLLAFSLISLLAAPLADAARLGKGRSYGMRRAAPTQSYQRPAAAPQQQPLPAQTAPQQPQRRGSGIGTAVAAGAAGAAVGYLAGSAMNNNAQAAPAQPTASAAAAAPAPAAAPVENKPAMPWNLIIVLGAVFLVGLMWFRRRMASPGNAPQAMRPQPVPPADGNNRFDPIPPIGSGFPGAAGNNGGFQPQAQSFEPRRLPDGTETPYFLRQVKATFLHLQSLNSPETLDEVRRYMTPELFNELQGEIAGNGMVADFTNLDCQLLEAGEEMGRFVASVRFSGLVSEEVGATPMPFTETWHFIKDATTHDKWMVAGIQQS